ncbi:MAG: HNH endonuclease signature motif containing protein [Frankia sp.]
MYTDIHHITPWYPDGRTDLANLITLCRWHHRDHHEGGYTIATRPDGSHTFHQPDGTLIPHPTTPPPPTPQTDKPPPDPTAITPTWLGEPLNINDTLTALLSKPAPHPAESQR